MRTSVRSSVTCRKRHPVSVAVCFTGYSSSCDESSLSPYRRTRLLITRSTIGGSRIGVFFEAIELRAFDLNFRLELRVRHRAIVVVHGHELLDVELQPFNVLREIFLIADQVDCGDRSIRWKGRRWIVEIGFRQDFLFWQIGDQHVGRVRIPVVRVFVVSQTIELNRLIAVAQDIFIFDRGKLRWLGIFGELIGIHVWGRRKVLSRYGLFSSAVTIVAPSATKVRRPPE